MKVINQNQKSYNRFAPNLAAGVLLLKMSTLLFSGNAVLSVLQQLPDSQLNFIMLYHVGDEGIKLLICVELSKFLQGFSQLPTNKYLKLETSSKKRLLFMSSGLFLLDRALLS